ncbi:Alpha/Beta hydrolase protein [Melanogaster broomeanus]|nr:Alpha/Beta hydrolase protein [Melanogaster broomeanus]
MISFFILLLASVSFVQDTVDLSYGSFQGFSSANSTESFLGIPFAQPPVGDLRFRQPLPPSGFMGIQQATKFGNACPQQISLAPNSTFPNSSMLAGAPQAIGQLMPTSNTTQSEDCLYLNVVRPANIATNANLPVVVWIYGGAFQMGDASAYNGVHIVARSQALGSEAIYVSFNYRVNGFGFLAGSEVQQEGVANLGLYDQRLALQWVQENIATFGGDPSRVIAWGQSAGAISIWLHMTMFDGELNGLFSGAVTQSGFAGPMRHLDDSQPIYDRMVEYTNCTNPAGGNSTLDCLRAAPYESLVSAINQLPPLLSYQSLATSFRPVVDGVMFKRTARESLEAGLYAQIPIIAGNVDDEGTLFSLLNVNVTTDQQFTDYVHSNYIPHASETQMQGIAELYPSEAPQGSPFRTGDNYTVTPQYKRISAFQGDYYFQAPRRFSLSITSATQKVWSYCINTVVSVAFHESDLQEFYELTPNPDFIGTDALLNFAYNLDPNVPAGGYRGSSSPPSQLTSITWPLYNSSPNGTLLTFEPNNVLNVTQDDYRLDAMLYLSDLQGDLGL